MDGEVLADKTDSQTLSDIISWDWIMDTSVNEIYIFEEVSLKFIKANQAALKNLRYSSAEFRRLTPLDIKTEMPPETFHSLLAKLKRGESRQVDFSSVHYRKDGSSYPVNVKLHLARHPAMNVFVAIIQDMTIQKEKEDALRESENKYRTLTENLPGVIARFDRDHRHRYINSRVTDYTGIPAERFITRTSREVGLDGEEIRQLEEFIDQVFQSGRPISKKTPYKNHTFMTTMIPEMNGAGKTETVLVALHDISDLEATHERLRQSETLFATIFDMVPSPVILIDTERGKVLKANRAFIRKTGLSVRKISGHSIVALGLLNDYESAWIRGKLLAGSDVRNFHYVFNPSGRRPPISGMLDIVPVKTADTLYALVLFTDTTTREDTERFLSLQHKLAVNLAAADSLPDAIDHILAAVLEIRGIDCGSAYLINPATGVAELRSWRGLPEKFAGRPALITPQCPGYHFFELTKPRYLTRAQLRKISGLPAGLADMGACAIIPVCEGDSVIAAFDFFSTSHARFDRQTRDKLEILAGQLSGIITRIKTQDDLRKSEQRYHDLNIFMRRISDNIPDPIWAKDSAGRYIFVNQAHCDMFLGCAGPDDALGRPDLEFAAMTEKPAGQRHSFGDLQLDSDQITRERQSPCRFFEDGFVSGKYLALDVHKAPLWEDGHLVGTVGCGRDITALKASEDSLRKAHAELETRVAQRTGELLKLNRKLEEEIAHRNVIERDLRIKDCAMEVSITPFSLTDSEGRLLYGNTALFELFGYAREEMLGDYLPGHFISPQKALEALRQNGSWIGDISIRLKNSGTCPVRFMCTRLHDDNGTPLCFVSSYIDMRPINNLQQKLVRSERLAATGQLAASVAHEINSPLQGIRALLNVIEQTHPCDQELLGNLMLVRQAFSRIKNTVISLLDLNRPDKETKQAIDLNRSIMDTVGLMNSLLRRKDIELSLDLADDLPAVSASPLQFGQVFMNLINNAAEAMDEAAPLSSRQIRIATGAQDGTIVMTVRDTGPGIHPDILNSIFDPFVTRKNGFGMGVGLAICRGIIEDHGGTIAARNRPEGGAEFEITLPIKELSHARKSDPAR